VTLWIRGDGFLFSPQIIVNGSSVSSELLEASGNGARVTAQSNGYQTDDSFFEEMKAVLPLLGGTKESPILLFVDGHGSRLQRRVIELLKQNWVYCIISPSHTSMVHQPLDNGVNASFQVIYNQLYTAMMNIKHSKITDAECARNIVLAIGQLQSSSVLRHAWKVVGLPQGTVAPATLEPSVFTIGIPYRDPSLPSVNAALIKHLFSPPNLILPPGSPCTIPDPSSRVAGLLDAARHYRDALAQANSSSFSSSSSSGSRLTYFLQQLPKDVTTMHRYMYTCARNGPLQTFASLTHEETTAAAEQIEGDFNSTTPGCSAEHRYW